MTQTIEVRFKGTRKAYFTWPDEGEALRVGDALVVEVERGRDLGRVTALGELAGKKFHRAESIPWVCVRRVNLWQDSARGHGSKGAARE